jgi:hypothetical protein
MDTICRAIIIISFVAFFAFFTQVKAYSSDPSLQEVEPTAEQASNTSASSNVSEQANLSKYILEITPPFLAVIVTMIVAYISYRQHKVTKERLRNELFDRRFKIYEAALTMLGYVGKRGLKLSIENVQDNDQCFEYFDNIKPAPFLFRKDLSDYLRHLGQSVIEMMACEDRLAGLSMDDPQYEEERVAIKKKRSTILKKLLAESDTFVDRFAPYLKFEDH